MAKKKATKKKVKRTVKRRKKKVKKKSAGSKAEAVRDYLKKNPDAKNKEVVAGLGKKGIKISENYPSIIKSQAKKRKKKKKRGTRKKKVSRSTKTKKRVGRPRKKKRKKKAPTGKSSEWGSWLQHNAEDFQNMIEIVKRAGEYNTKKLVDVAISAKKTIQGED